MNKGCGILRIGDATAFMCGGEPDHECNEELFMFVTDEGDLYFNTYEEGVEYLQKNNIQINGFSVACSICKRAAIDNAMHLDF